MALEKFGIKEVADVRFYDVENVSFKDGVLKVKDPTQPVLEFDTLKVSNIEFTAEQTDAKGGKGNLPLITWDYGREVNLTLEDALLSLKCMKALFGSVDETKNYIEIGGDSFPNNYAIIGTTFARAQQGGKDHLFTFYVPNAKMGSEITLNMEAEGDPTVFSMNMKALREKDGTNLIYLIADADSTYEERKTDKNHTSGDGKKIFDYVITTDVATEPTPEPEAGT